MNASEARELSKKYSHGHVIQPFLNSIYERIHAMAKMGKSELPHPFSSVNGKYPTIEEQEAITIELKKLGYKMTDHSDPDTGHPYSSGAYTSVSW